MNRLIKTVAFLAAALLAFNASVFAVQYNSDFSDLDAGVLPEKWRYSTSMWSTEDAPASHISKGENNSVALSTEGNLYTLILDASSDGIWLEAGKKYIMSYDFKLIAENLTTQTSIATLGLSSGKYLNNLFRVYMGETNRDIRTCFDTSGNVKQTDFGTVELNTWHNATAVIDLTGSVPGGSSENGYIYYYCDGVRLASMADGVDLCNIGPISDYAGLKVTNLYFQTRTVNQDEYFLYKNVKIGSAEENRLSIDGETEINQLSADTVKLALSTPIEASGISDSGFTVTKASDLVIDTSENIYSEDLTSYDGSALPSGFKWSGTNAIMKHTDSDTGRNMFRVNNSSSELKALDAALPTAVTLEKGKKYEITYDFKYDKDSSDWTGSKSKIFGLTFSDGYTLEIMRFFLNSPYIHPLWGDSTSVSYNDKAAQLPTADKSMTMKYVIDLTGETGTVTYYMDGEQLTNAVATGPSTYNLPSKYVGATLTGLRWKLRSSANSGHTEDGLYLGNFSIDVISSEAAEPEQITDYEIVENIGNSFAVKFPDRLSAGEYVFSFDPDTEDVAGERFSEGANSTALTVTKIIIPNVLTCEQQLYDATQGIKKIKVYYTNEIPSANIGVSSFTVTKDGSPVSISSCYASDDNSAEITFEDYISEGTYEVVLNEPDIYGESGASASFSVSGIYEKPESEEGMELREDFDEYASTEELLSNWQFKKANAGSCSVELADGAVKINAPDTNYSVISADLPFEMDLSVPGVYRFSYDLYLSEVPQDTSKPSQSVVASLMKGSESSMVGGVSWDRNTAAAFRVYVKNYPSSLYWSSYYPKALRWIKVDTVYDTTDPSHVMVKHYVDNELQGSTALGQSEFDFGAIGSECKVNKISFNVRTHSSEYIMLDNISLSRVDNDRLIFNGESDNIASSSNSISVEFANLVSDYRAAVKSLSVKMYEADDVLMLHPTEYTAFSADNATPRGFEFTISPDDFTEGRRFTVSVGEAVKDVSGNTFNTPAAIYVSSEENSIISLRWYNYDGKLIIPDGTMPTTVTDMRIYYNYSPYGTSVSLGGTDAQAQDAYRFADVKLGFLSPETEYSLDIEADGLQNPISGARFTTGKGEIVITDAYLEGSDNKATLSSLEDNDTVKLYLEIVNTTGSEQIVYPVIASYSGNALADIDCDLSGLNIPGGTGTYLGGEIVYDSLKNIDEITGGILGSVQSLEPLVKDLAVMR